MTKTKKFDEFTIDFSVWVPEVESFRTVFHRGRAFRISEDDTGPPLLLFPIGVMADAIARQTPVVARWERHGLWPKPMWAVDDLRCPRWYSSSQILMAHQEHWKLAKGDYGFSHSRHFPLAEFFRVINERFYRVDAEARGIVQPTATRSDV